MFILLSGKSDGGLRGKYIILGFCVHLNASILPCLSSHTKYSASYIFEKGYMYNWIIFEAFHLCECLNFLQWNIWGPCRLPNSPTVFSLSRAASMEPLLCFWCGSFRFVLYYTCSMHVICFCCLDALICFNFLYLTKKTGSIYLNMWMNTK